MSTFASTVNAAPAYLVNDIYKRYINPGASSQRLVRASYLISVLVVAISTLIGLFVVSINSVLQWIVSGLWGGYVVSNVLKWYWWRLNGMGYFWGMMVGILGAMVFPTLFAGVFDEVAPDILPLYLFPLLFLVSGAACVVASYLTQPEDPEILKEFYRTVRPWGFWRPVYRQVIAEDPAFARNRDFGRDMFNVTIGIITQTCLVAAPIFLVTGENTSLGASVALFGVSALVLKKTWYDKIERTP